MPRIPEDDYGRIAICERPVAHAIQIELGQRVDNLSLESFKLLTMTWHQESLVCKVATHHRGVPDHQMDKTIYDGHIH